MQKAITDFITPEEFTSLTLLVDSSYILYKNMLQLENVSLEDKEHIKKWIESYEVLQACILRNMMNPSIH